MLFTQEKINKLNAIEMDIYLFIENHSDEIEDMKIRELASVLHVSTATILRFCKKLGYSGYAEFKFKYKESLMHATPSNVEKFPNPAEDSEKYFKFESTHGADELEQKILEAVALMQKATKIIFIGDGTSGVLAKYGALFLTTMGKSAQYIDSSFIPIPVEDHSNTFIIALSVSGETGALINRLEGFKSLGATLTTITNGKDNTMSKLADIALYYDIPKEEFMVIGPQKSVIRVNGASQIPAMYLMETMIKACVKKTKKLM
ncbi:MAG: MurR/RpiR family transcriptional regulator [Turicibacter sp.]|nr:MurR/RpiR family transcriptional regulator [Turicibacter sp.]